MRAFVELHTSTTKRNPIFKFRNKSAHIVHHKSDWLPGTWHNLDLLESIDGYKTGTGNMESSARSAHSPGIVHQTPDQTWLMRRLFQCFLRTYLPLDCIPNLGRPIVYHVLGNNSCTSSCNGYLFSRRIRRRTTASCCRRHFHWYSSGGLFRTSDFLCGGVLYKTGHQKLFIPLDFLFALSAANKLHCSVEHCWKMGFWTLSWKFNWNSWKFSTVLDDDNPNVWPNSQLAQIGEESAS